MDHRICVCCLFTRLFWKCNRRQYWHGRSRRCQHCCCSGHTAYHLCLSGSYFQHPQLGCQHPLGRFVRRDFIFRCPDFVPSLFFVCRSRNCPFLYWIYKNEKEPAPCFVTKYFRAIKNKTRGLAGVHKTVNRPMVTIIGRFFVLCTGAGAPKAPLCKRSLGCSAKSYSTHYTGRRIEVRPLSVQQIGIGWLTIPFLLKRTRWFAELPQTHI